MEGWWHLERGRVAQRAGDHTRAVKEFQTVVRLWAAADPELQPFVAEARDAVRKSGSGR